MAQTQTWTDTGIAELILLLREELSTGMESIGKAFVRTARRYW